MTREQETWSGRGVGGIKAVGEKALGPGSPPPSDLGVKEFMCG